MAIDPAIKRNLFTLNRKVTLLKQELAKKDEALRQKDEEIRLLKIAAGQRDGHGADQVWFTEYFGGASDGATLDAVLYVG